MKKKVVACLMTGLLAGAMLAGCGSSSSGSTDSGTDASATTETSEAAQEDASAEDSGSGDATYNVGICQLIQHDALDAATQGFMDALTDELGDAVTFDEQNAQGDSNTCSTIVNSFVSNGVDLILANGTAALQAAQAGTNEIPILGTSITNYPVALGLDSDDELNGMNVSGTSDLAPLDEQAEMIQELLPDAKKIGLLYCSAEANSQFQVDAVKEYLEDMGYECAYYAFSDSNDLSSVTTSAAAECDAIYVPTDNTVAANTGIIDNICLPAGVPVVAGEEGICSGCGIATLSISYYELGYTTGQMAAKILTGEEDVSTMEVEYAPTVTKEYVKDRCDQLGITVTDEYTEIEAAEEE